MTEENTEEAGIKLSPKDEGALVEALHTIYNSPTTRQQMSLNSLEQAKKFSWDNFIHELKKIF